MGSAAIVISSHISNAKARDELLTSLLPQCMDRPIDIIVIIGGCESTHPELHRTGEGYYVAHCTHNSFEMTGLIEMYKRDVSWNQYFLLHDTCLVGPSFVDKILAWKPDDLGCTASLLFPSMNIGWYSASHLQLHRSILLDHMCETRTKLHDFKSHAVQYEDCIFKRQLALQQHIFMGGLTSVSEPRDYYATGVPRIVEHYECIDLYKMKANWHIKSSYELRL